MKTRTLRNSIRCLGLILAVFVSAANPASAQQNKDEKKSKQSIIIERSDDSGGDEESVRVEIKNGRTWINGVEVPEGDDITDYLPEGFDVTVLDREGRGRHMIFDSHDNADRRYEGFFSSDGEDGDEDVWVDGSDRRFKVRRAPNRNRRTGSAFSFGDNDELMELRDNLVEVGGDWGARASGFFADFGGSPTSPEIVKLEIESRRLGRELSRTEGETRQKVSDELDELLSNIFEKKTQVRVDALNELKETVKADEEAISSRKKDRQRMIEQRKSELAGEAKKNDW